MGKGATRKQKPAAAPGPRAQAAAPAADAPPPVPAFSDEWLADIARPRTLTVFGQDWLVKSPTGELATQWFLVNQREGIGASLALMMADDTPADEGRPPGSKAALQFIALVQKNVPVDHAEEFWLRIEAALFPGEAPAS